MTVQIEPDRRRLTMNAPALLDAALEPKAAEPEPMETDEALYEFVNGQRVEMPPMSIRARIVAARFAAELATFGKTSGLGEVFPEMLFRIPLTEDEGRERRPDISFVSYKNWPTESPLDPDANAWEVIPDLAIEVTSPSDKAEDQREKILEYFRVGVRCVWVVYPRLRLIDVYESPTSIRVLSSTETLRGEPVLPGFEVSVSSLFESARPK
jgi:Uma2 family endonuclease